MRVLFYSFLLKTFLFAVVAQGQNTTVRCDCKAALHDLIVKLESNYIGYVQRKGSAQDVDYEESKSVSIKKANDITPENCTAFLLDFVDQFNDGHLFVVERPKYTDDERNYFKSEIKSAKLSEDSLFRLNSGIVKSGPGHSSLLGKWTDGQSAFLISGTMENGYYAHVLHSTLSHIERGELKARITPRDNRLYIQYFNYKYEPRFIRGALYKEEAWLQASGLFWQRLDTSISTTSATITKANLQRPGIVKLNDQNTLLTIPSFLIDYAAFKAFLETNRQTIVNSENVIIDIRGNRGGNAIYFNLIKLYATNDMEGSQGLVLASKDNLNYFNYRLKNSKKIYKPLIDRISTNLGSIVDGPLYPKKRFKPANTKIRNVAILTDQGCMSAAESFILHSKRASTKVLT
ncbi:MAG: S41 family peptidase, partial [Bacteroidota bacterium]